jgi:hypothetical protein
MEEEHVVGGLSAKGETALNVGADDSIQGR